MKISHFARIAGMVLFVALTVTVSCNNDAKNTAETNQETTDNSNIDTGIAGIAFLKADSVIQNYDLYHDLEAEFEKMAKQKETEFSGKAKALQRDINDFQEKYEKGLMTRSTAEEQSQKLQRRQQDLETTGTKMREQLAEEQAVMLRKIQDALLKYIEKYNADKKYSLILNSSTILYGSSVMDITQDILKGLNEEYSVEKGK